MTEKENQFLKILCDDEQSFHKKAVEVCEGWRLLTNAHFVTLRLLNPIFGTLEKTASSSPQGVFNLPIGKESVADASLALLSNQWLLKHQGAGDTPEATPAFHLPLNSLEISSVLSAYFVEESIFQRHDELASWVGAIQGIFRKFFIERKLRLLQKLSETASRHVERILRRPEDSMAQYIEDLIKIISAEVGSRFVSIYYTGSSQKGPQLIGGHAIWNQTLEDSAELEQTELACSAFNTRSAKIDCLTRSKFHSNNGFSPESDKIWVLSQPILGMPDKGGVIQCIDKIKVEAETEHKGFTPLDIEILSVIAANIAPILEMFVATIERKRLTAFAKHDLLAPLAMIRDTSSSIVRKHSTDDQLRRDCKYLEYAVFGLLSTVEFLDSDPLEIRPLSTVQPTFLDEVVKRVVSLNTTINYDLKIRFKRLDFPPLFVNRHLVEIAISNLINNAMKYGDDKTVLIDGHSSLQNYILHVSHFGGHISPEDAHLIFSEGYRTAKGASRAFGSGLGLAIVATIMKRHGGSAVISSLSDPTTFSLYFPKELREQKPD